MEVSIIKKKKKKKRRVLFIVHCARRRAFSLRHKRRTSFIPFHPLQPWISSARLEDVARRASRRHKTRSNCYLISESHSVALACRLVLPVEEVFTRKHASPSMCIRFSAVDFIRYAEFGTAFFFF